mmetsp:Transcript_3317/g.8580  ORF Transcript_3317/g.8580 Transcript_3317/m.8580 type:complete len:138 (+) Transcript_3317:31-444(+)
MHASSARHVGAQALPRRDQGPALPLLRRRDHASLPPRLREARARTHVHDGRTPRSDTRCPRPTVRRPPSRLPQNVIVGANGAGKSNVLDAALFALGQDASQMRSRSWTELTSRARGGPCAVRYGSPTALRASARRSR